MNEGFETKDLDPLNVKNFPTYKVQNFSDEELELIISHWPSQIPSNCWMCLCEMKKREISKKIYPPKSEVEV